MAERIRVQRVDGEEIATRAPQRGGLHCHVKVPRPRRRRGILLALSRIALAAALPAQETVLRVMIHPPYFDGWDILVEVAREFEREHPGLRIEVLSSASAVGEEYKLKLLLAARLPLDVTWIDVQEFGAFLAEDVLLDLQPFFDEDARRGRWNPDDYFEAPLRAFCDERGHLYGLPSTFTPYVIYYNADLLDAAGVPHPREGWTWADLEEAAARTTVDRDGDGRPEQWGLSLTQWLQAIAPWIWQNGGRLLDEKGEHSALAEPEAVEALRFLTRLLHERKVAAFDATLENQITFSLFQAGKVALYGPVGYWETYRFKTIRDFAWDVAPLPRGRAAATAVAMRSYVVPRTTRHPREAYEFVRALASERMQRGLARIGNGVPGLKRAAWSEDFLKPDVAPRSERVFLDAIAHARFMPVLANWREIETLCKAELDGALLLGKVDAATAGRRMAVKTDDFLARERAWRTLPRIPRGLPVLVPVLAVVTLLAAIAARRRRPTGRLARREERAALAFLLPWGVGFLALALGPAALSALLAGCEWSPLRDLDDARWVGGGNFARLAADETFRDALCVTATYALVSVPLGVAFSLGVALLLDRKFRLAGLARTLAYIPTVISPVIVGAMWRWILDERGGLLNRGLEGVGIPGPAWLASERFVLPAFVLMGLWTTGAQTLVFLAALQSLDPTLRDAARIDGAGPVRRFRHVVLPALSPVVLFNLVVGTINAFQLFGQAYVMTQGGPGNASRFLVLYLYETAFKFLQMGYASAQAWALFAILLIVTLLLLGSARRWVHYEART